jgi:hypothetical protein
MGREQNKDGILGTNSVEEMTDRRQIADELWEAHKHWEGERKFALRQITKHLTGREGMSSWHYQIMRHTADSGEDYLAIHEFYTMHDGKEGWTQKAVPIEADTVSDLRMALINILRDLERHGVRDAQTGEVVQNG